MNNLVQSNSFNTDIEGALERVRIIGVSILSEIKGFLSPGGEQIVRT